MKKSKIDFYETATKKEVTEILKKIKWFVNTDKTEFTEDDLNLQFITDMYSGIQSFGATDYKDHRNDTAEQIKNIITKSLLNHQSQRGHYYDSNGNKPKKIVATGYLGGYTAKFIYPNGENGFGRKAN